MTVMHTMAVSSCSWYSPLWFSSHWSASSLSITVVMALCSEYIAFTLYGYILPQLMAKTRNSNYLLIAKVPSRLSLHHYEATSKQSQRRIEETKKYKRMSKVVFPSQCDRLANIPRKMLSRREHKKVTRHYTHHQRRIIPQPSICKPPKYKQEKKKKKRRRRLQLFQPNWDPCPKMTRIN